MKVAAPSKHFCCTVCHRGFTRIDHLKRHQLRHSGVKPYSCIFCNESFARCDNLRDHYSDCAKRGDQKIPETGQRGRRRHACQSCTSMKLRCDGMSPCSSCQKRNLQCNNEQKSLVNNSDLDSSVTLDSSLTPGKRDDCDSSNRGSIKFLLNGGTDSFTEEFLLPPRSDRARSLKYHNNKGLGEVGSSILNYPMGEDQADFAPAFIESDVANLEFFQENFLDFFNGPFGDPNRVADGPYAGPPNFSIGIPPVADPALPFAPQPPYEPEEPFAAALYHAILARACSVPLDRQAQERLATHLSFLLSTSRIRKFVLIYEKCWQPSCAMVHLASLNLATVPSPLLAAIVFMGAMYSRNAQEVFAAKQLLDFVELFIFSSETYSPESEVASMFSGARNFDNVTKDWDYFQNFQAGFIIVIVQYWAGSRGSRNRAMENRFSEVIKVARRLGLLKCRHQHPDVIPEYQWIQTESRIRTINIILLLDCAFSFFQNYPCRLSHTEAEFDFPCAESVFALAHPYTDFNFQAARGIIVSETFRNLFEDYHKDTMPSTPDSSASSNMASLTVLDMFVLIHLLYTFINTHMTLLAPIIRDNQPQFYHPKQFFPFESSDSSRGANGNGNSLIPDDSMLGAIRVALSRWREHWITLRNTVSRCEWAEMGFYKNGYNFWLVSQLLITKKQSLDVVMQMEVKCEDKLDKLKVLLMDDD